MERSLENSAGGDPGGIIQSRRQRDSGAVRLAAANLMGRGGGFVLPKLDGTPTEYRIAEEDNRAIRLAQRLTALDIADPHDWEGADRTASRYILATLKRWIGNHSGETIQRQFALNTSISSSPDPYVDDEHGSHLLYLTVNPDSAGYVVIGPTLELLAAIHSRLPVSFYRLIVDSVKRWIRVYDYDDALDRLEMLRDWVEGEDDPDQYEFPDVEGCIPTLMKEEPLELAVMRELAQEIQDEQIVGILRAAFDLHSASQKNSRAEISDETREASMDSNPPLPALLVSFKRHDAAGTQSACGHRAWQFSECTASPQHSRLSVRNTGGGKPARRFAARKRRQALRSKNGSLRRDRPILSPPTSSRSPDL